MKVVGNKVHDYYDGCLSYHDKSGNVYLREPNIVEFNPRRHFPLTVKKEYVKPNIDDRIKFLVDLNFSFNVYNIYTKQQKHAIQTFKVLVAGKIYGGVRIEQGHNGTTLQYFYFYSYNALIDFMKNLKLSYEKYLEEPVSYWNNRDIKISKYLENWFNVVDCVENCINNKLVIALLEKSKISLDCELKRIEFYKKMDAFTIYNELQMWVDGCLSSPGNQIIEIEDKYKIEGHGFDPRYGFRTRPK